MQCVFEDRSVFVKMIEGINDLCPEGVEDLAPKVVVAGLSGDYRRKPFGKILEL